MDSTLACLAAWMPRQRWYAAKGRTPALRLVAAWDHPFEDADVRVRTLIVIDDSSLPPVLYQVPVVERPTTAVADDVVGVVGSPRPGTTVIDGTADSAYTAALLSLAASGGAVGDAYAGAAGRPAASLDAPTGPYRARVLSGEQSNTSIIYTAENGGAPVICKVYRQLHAGLNPDIELQTALAEAASPFVPRAVGSVEGRWPDPASAASTVSGSLAFAQEFLPGVEDAWRVALSAAARGEDFTDRAAVLGTATAGVHEALARLLPTRKAAPEDRARMRETWERRLSTAVAEIPELAALRQSISAVYLRAEEATWPALQRIHGDYHLGQVILVPRRGWVLLDFEGEPLRPMSERLEPDLALRDVAGMLRSFDYVAGSIRLDQPERASAEGWSESARRAFLAGYGDHAPAELLEALELDKAVYEALYEARNRPTWIPIPLSAIARLLQAR